MKLKYHINFCGYVVSNQHPTYSKALQGFPLYIPTLLFSSFNDALKWINFQNISGLPDRLSPFTLFVPRSMLFVNVQIVHLQNRKLLLFVTIISSILTNSKSFLFSGNYILNYLATRPKLPNFVIQALVTLFARISKLGWFDSDKDEYVFRNVISDVTKFLQVCLFFLSKSNFSSSSYQRPTLNTRCKLIHRGKG